MLKTQIVLTLLLLQAFLNTTCFAQFQVLRNSVVNDNIINAIQPFGVVKCNNGDWVATFQDKGDTTAGCKVYFIRSTDQGQTWSQPFKTVSSEDETVGLTIQLFTLPNGVKLAIFITIQHQPSIRNFDITLYSCSDDFQTFTEIQKLTHPAQSIIFTTGNCITELGNGDLIIPGYIYPQGTPVEGAVYGSGFFRSTNGGQTWGQFELVFNESDPNNKKNFTESTFAVKADNTIVGFARVDTTETKNMWKTISTDNGTTWSSPIETNIPAIYPMITHLDNGKYVMICGLLSIQPPRTVAFMLSDDGENFKFAGQAYYTLNGGSSYNTATGGSQAFLQVDQNKLFIMFYAYDPILSGLNQTYIDGNLVAISSILENNIEESLVLNILCNESSGTTVHDNSSFTNNGTLLNGGLFSDSAILLDGINDQINCGDKDPLEIGTQDLTLLARVKLNANQNTYAGIITKGASSSTNPGYSLVYTVGNGKLNFLISNGVTRLWLTSNANLGLNDGMWHTIGVTVTRNGDVIFYVDGNPVGNSNISSFSTYNITNENCDLLIGSWVNSWHLSGKIDNIQVYMRALTLQEMIDLDGEVQLNMQFNEVILSNPVDSSIYSNNGILLNGAILGNGDGMLVLDGTNERVSCMHNSSLDISTNNMSIIAKVNMNASQGTYTGIVTKGASSPTNPGYSLVYTVGNGKLNFLLSNGITRLWLTSNANLGLNDGMWHTIGVTVTRNGDVIFYVDGNPVGNSNISSLSTYNITNENCDLLIGSWVNSWHLRGMIDYILVYKRALTTQEILDRE